MVSLRAIYLHLIANAYIGAAHPHVYSPLVEHHALPQPLPIRDPSSKLDIRQAAHDVIRGGGWLLNYQASGTTYDGTMRVENNQSHLIISGDLYKRMTIPDPAGGIPIFPADSHDTYIRVTSYGQGVDSFDLAFELWRSSGKDSSSGLVWSNPQISCGLSICPTSMFALATRNLAT